MAEAAKLKWRAKRNRDGAEIKGCWVTDTGYTVAECRLPEQRFTVTSPRDSAPFAYVGTSEEVLAVILADIQASREAEHAAAD